MNALHFVFKTDRFNLSKVGAHFINPCCFGEDLAAWLREQLSNKGVIAREPSQKDWGWGLPSKRNGQSYYLGISGNSNGGTENPDEGEWRVIVEKKRTLWQRITGKGKIRADDSLLVLIKQILIADAGIRDVQMEQN
jgi:hypothetical protein